MEPGVVLSSVEVASVLAVEHWAAVKSIHAFKSKSLQEVFRFVEAAPLLCVLEDFLVELDKLFVQNESILAVSRETTASFSGRISGGCVDADYVQALEVYCLLRQRLLDIQCSWRSVVTIALLPMHKGFIGFAEASYCHIESSMEMLVGSAHSILQSYSEPSLPKISLFYHKLGLTDKEQAAMSYIFMHNVGVLFGKLHSRFTAPSSPSTVSGSRHTSMALAAAAFAKLNSKEMLEFFDSDRPHLQQEIFEPEDEFSTLQMATFIKMPNTVLKACCGCALRSEELYKIDNTAIAEVLAASGSLDSNVLPSEKQATTDDADSTPEDIDSHSGGDEELQVNLEKSLDTTEQPVVSTVAVNSGEALQDTQSYSSDLAYLEDNFELIEVMIKARKTELDDDALLYRADQRKPETVVRELKAKARSIRAKITQKLDATYKQESWLPRLERLAALRGLDSFEKNVLLILTGFMVSRNLRNSGSPANTILGHTLSIGSLIGLLCEGLKEQIESRIYFYKNSKLVAEGLVHIEDPPLHSRGNFLDSVVELDRRLLDYIVGLDTEINEVVDGSDLYTPQVTLADVSLPGRHRQMLTNIFESFEEFQKACKSLRMNTKGTSQGLCLLFYGPSGTGKTMTANALASYLKKKVLLVTVSVVMERDLTKELVRFLFREAKIHNAILFFDECESLFETRDSRPNHTLGVLLTEVEQYEGIIILATNRHQDLDEAMHRRIQLALPFSTPDYTMRVEIWKSHVPDIIAPKDINWAKLALSYELTGGLIRNAVLSALSLALKECTTSDETKLNVVLSEDQLNKGAQLQLTGLLEMIDFERRVIPTFGLRDIVLDESIMQQLQLLLNAGKTHKFLSAQWGFGSAENVAQSGGIACLLCGRPGVGKTAIAHAIAYELGQPVKEANCAELLAHSVTLTPRANRGVAAFFRDAHKANAVVVLDGADILLSSVSSSLMSGVVGCEHYTLAHEIEHFKGIVVLTSRRELPYLDLNRLPRLRYVLDIHVPGAELREQLWRNLVPSKLPLDNDVNFWDLAQRYQFTGGDIANTICHAAESIALTAQSCLNHDSLSGAADSEVQRKRKNIPELPSIFQ